MLTAVLTLYWRPATISSAMSVDNNTFLPMKPLLDWWESTNRTHKRTDCPCADGGVCGSKEALAARLNVSRATLNRRVTKNEISMAEADKWAGQLKLHPSTIWPNWDRRPVQAAMTPRRSQWTGGRII